MALRRFRISRHAREALHNVDAELVPALNSSPSSFGTLSVILSIALLDIDVEKIEF